MNKESDARYAPCCDEWALANLWKTRIKYTYDKYVKKSEASYGPKWELEILFWWDKNRVCLVKAIQEKHGDNITTCTCSSLCITSICMIYSSTCRRVIINNYIECPKDEYETICDETIHRKKGYSSSENEVWGILGWRTRDITFFNSRMIVLLAMRNILM